MDKKQPGAIMMVAGGALMALGSLLTWLTASFDAAAFADAIKQQTGVDITGVPGFADASQSSSIAGIKGWEGKLALIGGLLVLAVGIASLLGAVNGSRAARSAFIGAAIGIFGAAYVLIRKPSGVAEAKASATAAMTAAGVSPSVLDNVFKISNGVGLYVVLVGGLVAIVGGIMLLGKDAPAATVAAPGEATVISGSGWDAPATTTPPHVPSAVPPVTPQTTSGESPPPPPPMGDTGGDGPS